MDESWMKRPSPLTRICIDPRLDRAEDDRPSHRGRIGSTTKGLFWKHEAIAHRIADMAATTFAMDSFPKLASAMSLPEGRPRELPRHVGLPGEDGAEAGLPLPVRGRRHGALRDGGDAVAGPPDGG